MALPLALLLAGRQGRAQAGGTGMRPLPPALAALLPAQEPASSAADIRRLRAAWPQWRTDLLGRLLVFARLGHDFYRLQQNDSTYQCLLRAWHLATPTLRHRQPAEVVKVADGLALYFYGTGATDSTYYYFRQASQLFGAARLDSTQAINQTLPSAVAWGGGATLAGSLANAGSASRALGDVPRALRSIEQATSLYQTLGLANGLAWAQSLLGETYAAQDNAGQALLAYEQACRTAKRLLATSQHDGSVAMADVLLDYYAPLLLAQPSQAARVPRLATELRQELLRNAHPAGNLSSLRADIVNPLVRLDLLLAQAGLQANRPAEAHTWLTSTQRWLRYASRTGLASEHDLFYAELRADYLSLLAWQHRAANPAATCRLLTQAVALLNRGGQSSPQRQNRLLLAQFCVLMREPGSAVQLLRPLLPAYQQQVRRHFAALPPEGQLLSPTVRQPTMPELVPTSSATTLAAPPATTRRRLVPTAPYQLEQWQVLAANQLANECFGPAELADLLCLSERTLYRRLGELTGLTPAAWLRELRLDKARQLLEAGSFGSVAAVAKAVGFASTKYFATLYAERFGRRPSDYRG